MALNKVAQESIADNVAKFGEATCIILVKSLDGTTLYIPVNMDDAEATLYKEHLQKLIDSDAECVDNTTTV